MQVLLPPLEVGQAFPAPSDPHLTSVIFWWLEDALLFATGKESNLKANKSKNTSLSEQSNRQKEAIVDRLVRESLDCSSQI